MCPLLTTTVANCAARLIGQDGKCAEEVTLSYCRDGGHAVFRARKFTGTTACVEVWCSERLLYGMEREAWNAIMWAGVLPCRRRVTPKRAHDR